jgi:peptidoglycan-associated lipoprotein
MNRNTVNLLKLAALWAAVAVVAGCKTDNYYETPLPPGRSSASQASVPIAPPPQQEKTARPTPDITSSVAAVNSGPRPAWNEDRSSLDADKVYFSFDKSTIKSNEKSKLDEVASFLRGNPQDSVRIEGNCDERGTEEYNRELGQRRAMASCDYLVSLGIVPSRIQTLSRGRDNPVGAGMGAKARAMNRRDEFAVLAPDKVL